MKIYPAKRLKGILTLGGDKSISHRAAMISAMAEGETRIENFSTSADCASTLGCLENLGVEIRRESSTVFVKGVGKTGFQKPENALDCGNSGTTDAPFIGNYRRAKFCERFDGRREFIAATDEANHRAALAVRRENRSARKSSAAQNLRQKSFGFNRIRARRRFGAG